MKNSKLFKNGKIFIRSMKTLIERYQKALALGISKEDYEDDNDLDCLLCNPLGTKKTQSFYVREIESNVGWDRNTFRQACKKLGCPWMVILGMTCTEFSNLKDDDIIYCSSDPVVIKRRIRQIRNWIKIYEKHMEEKNGKR